MRFFLWVMLGLAISFSGIAETIRIQPIADTTLAEVAPNNNLGGTAFVNAGTAGVNASGARNRGLYRFDFSPIPASSKIKSALVKLEVIRAGSGTSSSFALHRMLRTWGEGNKDSTLEQSPGVGFLATTNEATWNSPFALTTNFWTTPGASNDFASVVSSRTDVFGVGDFPVFSSTPQMMTDVQTWLDNPLVNFGWLLKTETEGEYFTARRFGSREFIGGDTNSPPYVEVIFVPPPTIFGTRIVSGQFRFTFLAEASQSYTVQFKNTLNATNLWQTLTNISAPITATNILISDALSTNARFYRVVFP